jgi:hypothetical protein
VVFELINILSWKKTQNQPRRHRRTQLSLYDPDSAPMIKGIYRSMHS